MTDLFVAAAGAFALAVALFLLVAVLTALLILAARDEEGR